MAYKCKKCGNTNTKFLGEMQAHSIEIGFSDEEGKTMKSDISEPTGKNLIVCLDCTHIGYLDDFEPTEE